MCSMLSYLKLLLNTPNILNYLEFHNFACWYNLQIKIIFGMKNCFILLVKHTLNIVYLIYGQTKRHCIFLLVSVSIIGMSVHAIQLLYSYGCS